MSNTSVEPPGVQRADHRIRIGFLVSALWLAGGIWFVMNVGQWSPRQYFSLESVGSFLEAVFAALACQFDPATAAALGAICGPRITPPGVGPCISPRTNVT